MPLAANSEDGGLVPRPAAAEADRERRWEEANKTAVADEYTAAGFATAFQTCKIRIYRQRH